MCFKQYHRSEIDMMRTVFSQSRETCECVKMEIFYLLSSNLFDNILEFDWYTVSNKKLFSWCNYCNLCDNCTYQKFTCCQWHLLKSYDWCDESSEFITTTGILKNLSSDDVDMN
jgi:hypothetical protein